MAVICAFNEVDGLTSISSINRLRISTSTTYGVITGVSRSVFGSDLNNMTMTRDLGQVVTEGWAHVRLYPRSDTPSTVFNGGNLFSLLDEDGNTIAAIYANSQSSTTNPNIPLVIQANGVGGLSGTLYTAPRGSNNLLDIDINFKVADSGGFYRVYFAGELVYEFLGDTQPGASTGIRTIRFDTRGTEGTGATEATYFSQVIVSTASTIGARVHTLALTDFGDTNDWAGAVADINGTGLDPYTALSEDTLNGSVLFTKGTMGAIAGSSEITAVLLGTKGRYVAGSAVTTLRGIAKLSTTVYDAATAAALAESSAAYGLQFPVNPATALNWTVADVNAAQIGAKAEA